MNDDFQNNIWRVYSSYVSYRSHSLFEGTVGLTVLN